MPFLPDTFITITYAVALFLASLLALRLDYRSWPVLAVMWGNWIATRAITATEAPSYMAGIADISSAIVLLVLWRFRTMAVLPVAALFGLMVISYGLNDLGLIERETMWAFADVAAYAQLLIIIGIASGGGKRVWNMGFSHRRGDSPVVHSVASRVQD